MAIVKTAISMQRPLFQQVEILAKEMQVSRSRVFVLAVEEFLRRQRYETLLEQINAAYPEPEDPKAQALRLQRREHHRRLLKSEW